MTPLVQLLTSYVSPRTLLLRPDERFSHQHSAVMPLPPNDPPPARMIETRTGVDRMCRVQQDHLGPTSRIGDHDGLTMIRIRQPSSGAQRLFDISHDSSSRRPFVKDIDGREGEKVRFPGVTRIT